MTKVVCLKPSAGMLRKPSYLCVLSSHMLVCSCNFAVKGVKASLSLPHASWSLVQALDHFESPPIAGA